MCFGKVEAPEPIKIEKPVFVRNPFLDDDTEDVRSADAMRRGRSSLVIPTGTGIGFEGEGGVAGGSAQGNPNNNSRNPNLNIRGSGAGQYQGGAGGGPGGDGERGRGGGCFEFGTEFVMADGSVKAVQDIALRDEMALGGKVEMAIIGDGHTEDWYDVAGVHVTSAHLMLQGDRWIFAEDAIGAKAIKERPAYYVVVNENHRMLAKNGQIFGDFADTAYDDYGSGWNDFLLDTLNGETSHKFVEWEQQRLEAHGHC